MTMVMSPANTISVTKWRPNTTRNDPTAVPNTIAAPSATGRTCGGARIAGAVVQKAWLASPDTKEQFRLPRRQIAECRSAAACPNSP
jgi:hypothetical protein